MADTTAVSYLAATAAVTGIAAESTDACEGTKYLELSNCYNLYHIAFDHKGR